MMSRRMAILPLALAACSGGSVAAQDASGIRPDSKGTESGCLAGATACDGAESIALCVRGGWEVLRCDALCVDGRSLGCGRLDDADTCLCVRRAGFGEVCGWAVECEAGLVCHMVTLAQGICAKRCCDRPPCAWPMCPSGNWCGPAGLCERS
jgi:hypothetical protein